MSARRMNTARATSMASRASAGPDLRLVIAELEGKRTIYVHCRSGNRSQRAIETLERLGLDAEFVNVDGGQMVWESQGSRPFRCRARCR